MKAGVNISYWDVQFQATRYLYNQLSVIPSVNLITNVGFGDSSTHAQEESNCVKLNQRIGKINCFNNERYELIFPLLEPKFIISNYEYDLKVDRFIYGKTLKKIIRSFFRKVKKYVC